MKPYARTLILILIRILGLPGALLALFRAKEKQLQPRILLMRPDHLGDLILVTPLLYALKQRLPNAHVTMMVGPWSREIVARHPGVDAIITCPFPGFQRAPQKPLDPYKQLLRLAWELRKGHYDLALNLRPDFWWGGALLYLTGIPRRIGYNISPGAQFLTHALPFVAPEHATISNLRLLSIGLQSLGQESLILPYTPRRYPLYFQPTSSEQQWVDERLQEAGVSPDTPLVIIHPGTGAAVKLWRNEAWTDCANMLVHTLTFPAQARIILTGSKSEAPMLTEIAQGIDQSALIFSDMTVGQLAALLTRAALVMGVDSGPLHLAIAEDAPTIQIFGPTDPQIFGPWGVHEHHIVIRATERCASCSEIPCNRLDFSPEELPQHPCVKRVSEQEVEIVIATILGIEPSTPKM